MSQGKQHLQKPKDHMTVVFPWDLNDKLRINPRSQVRSQVFRVRDTISPKGNPKKDHMTVAFPWDLTYHYLQLLYCE